TELDRRRLAAMLPADADLELGPRSPAELDRQLDELADALLIEDLERVVPQDAVLHVERQEPAGVVAREAEGRLREDRKSTRLNSSHVAISYAVFCLKKKKT